MASIGRPRRHVSLLFLGQPGSGRTAILEMLVEKKTSPSAFVQLQHHLELAGAGAGTSPPPSFASQMCTYTVRDTSGHRLMFKNLITGTNASDDVALVCLSASALEEWQQTVEPLIEQIKLAQTAGVSRLVVAITHLGETRGEAVFTTIQRLFIATLTERLGYIASSSSAPDSWTRATVFVPVASSSWYKGPSILQALDAMVSPPSLRMVERPLRMPLRDVYKIGGIGTVPFVRVETGVLRPA